MKLLKKKDHFLFLAILVFVFVSSSALAISGQVPVILKSLPVVAKQEKEFPPIPVLTGKSQYPVLSAQGVMAVDLASGINLYEKNADSQLLPASTTKIITALVSLDAYNLDQILTVGKEAKVDGQKMGLYIGEQMKVEDLLYGLLVYSANDAAEVLATNYVGGYDSFINAMNAKAGELNMVNSHFDNPVGLDTVGQKMPAKI